MVMFALACCLASSSQLAKWLKVSLLNEKVKQPNIIQLLAYATILTLETRNTNISMQKQTASSCLETLDEVTRHAKDYRSIDNSNNNNNFKESIGTKSCLF
jgi:hypothetical protein